MMVCPAPARFGPPLGNVWLLTSEAQNRPLIRKAWLDPDTGKALRREGFSNHHPIDQAVDYGIAQHEGQLFGLANQLFGLATALTLFTMAFTMAISGFVLWRRRKPVEGLVLPRLPGLARWLGAARLSSAG